jgi:hypothetical protein
LIMSATKRKVISIPTLAERARVLLEELLEAPTEEQREVLMAWREALDCAISDLAENLRPKGHVGIGAAGETAVVGSIPVGFVKMQLMARGFGECPCHALAEILKDQS